MLVHKSGEEESEEVRKKALPNSSSSSDAIPSDVRLDLSLLKYELFVRLQERNPLGWTEYWQAMQQFLIAKISKKELDELVWRLVGQSVSIVHLHNAFLTAIFHNANSTKLPPNCADYLLERNTLQKTPPAAVMVTNQQLGGCSGTIIPESPTALSSTLSKDDKTAPASLKRRRSSSKSIAEVESNEHAIRKTLEITRSKAIRSKCKIAEQKCEKIMSLISNSKKSNLNMSNSGGNPPKLKFSQESISTTSYPHIMHLPFNPKKLVHTGAYVSVNPLKRNPLPKLEYLVSEKLLDSRQIKKIMQEAAENEDLTGPSGDAVNIMKYALEEHLREIISACVESVSEMKIMTNFKLTPNLSNPEVSEIKQRTKFHRINSWPRREIAWPIEKPWNKHGNGGDERYCKVFSNRSNRTCPSPQQKMSDCKFNKSEPKKDPQLVEISNLQDAITNYPKLAGISNLPILKERIANMIDNNFEYSARTATCDQHENYYYC